ncbi:MAG: circadian clock KaiB family protein [Proteobacteria bacterium]|nr:circadian clock KaiB family protein [Pseudomonadota bacterium]MBU4357449.1 circadian clock KaiB family protein [Pseudomonadota bacterium]MBU4449094.1 circadian clock KaiB family protein [Pseudomonadota bacterium]
MEEALAKKDEEKYLLRLYVAGTTTKSRRAIANLKKICEEYLPGRYELEVIDIYQQPIFARDGQIVAAPTLVKELPPPLRKFIGDLSNTERILAGLDLRPKQ